MMALPMVGASSGETPIMRKRRENTLALSLAGKKSRTMAMAATWATQPPRASRKRRATKVRRSGRTAQPMEARM